MVFLSFLHHRCHSCAFPNILYCWIYFLVCLFLIHYLWGFLPNSGLPPEPLSLVPFLLMDPACQLRGEKPISKSRRMKSSNKFNFSFLKLPMTFTACSQPMKPYQKRPGRCVIMVFVYLEQTYPFVLEKSVNRFIRLLFQQ